MTDEYNWEGPINRTLTGPLKSTSLTVSKIEYVMTDERAH